METALSGIINLWRTNKQILKFELDSIPKPVFAYEIICFVRVKKAKTVVEIFDPKSEPY